MDGHGKSAGGRARACVWGGLLLILEFYYTRCATFWPVPWGFDFESPVII